MGIEEGGLVGRGGGGVEEGGLVGRGGGGVEEGGLVGRGRGGVEEGGLVGRGGGGVEEKLVRKTLLRTSFFEELRTFVACGCVRCRFILIIVRTKNWKC